MERGQRLIELFDEGSELRPEERPAFLALKCAGDATLLNEVRTLLDCAERAEADQFMNGAALEFEAQQVSWDYVGEERAGQLYGQYKLLSLLGAGGMGEVYLAEDTELQRKVALKLVTGGLKTKEVLRRFHNEQLILASLEHPNIARLLSVGATPDGLPFIVMEYIQGERIDKYADEHRLSISARLRLFRTVCAAVTYAHQHLVVHRDIKPSNILVTADGTPKLLDFGIAKLFNPEQAAEPLDATATMLRAMTPEYASPEQVRGETATTATDIYSLGVLLYELLVGRRPYRFKSTSPDEIARVICTAEPERPSQAIADSPIDSRNDERPSDDEQASGVKVSSNPQSAIRNPKSLKGDLDNIILKALRKEPARRYASVGEFSEDIRRHLAGLPVTARKDTFTYRASKFVRRNRLGVAAAAVALFTLAGGVVATAWEARVARAERARAERRFNELRGLANSFIFDLNDEIYAGPTKAREMLVSKALEYLDGLAREARDDAALKRELAAAYLKVGDVQGHPGRANVGHTDEALVSYRKAVSILESLPPSESAKPETLRELGNAYENIGRIQTRGDGYATALETQRKVLAMRQRLLAAEPNNVDNHFLIAQSYMRQGDALAIVLDQAQPDGDYTPVLDSYRQALRISEELCRLDPLKAPYIAVAGALHQRIGTRLNLIGERSRDPEKFRSAIESHQESLKLWEGLSSRNPDDPGYCDQIATELIFIGVSQTNLGEPQAALDNFEKARSIVESLTAQDPDNIEVRYDLAYLKQNTAKAWAKTGDLAKAVDTYRQALRFLEQLLAANPSRTVEAYTYLTAGYKGLAELLERHHKMDEALESRLKEFDTREKLSALTPSALQIRSEQAGAEADIGRLYESLAGRAGASRSKRRESWREARAWYQKSLDIWQEARARGRLSDADAGQPDELARALARCDTALAR